jgi:hypothetical protein
MHGAGRLRQDRLVGRAATTTDGAAAAVEQAQFNTVLVGQCGNVFLCLVEVPGRGKNAAILQESE